MVGMVLPWKVDLAHRLGHAEFTDAWLVGLVEVACLEAAEREHTSVSLAIPERLYTQAEGFLGGYLARRAPESMPVEMVRQRPREPIQLTGPQPMSHDELHRFPELVAELSGEGAR